MVFLVQILKADELRPGQGNVVMLVAYKLETVKPHRIAVQRDHIKGVRSLVGAAFRGTMADRQMLLSFKGKEFIGIPVSDDRERKCKAGIENVDRPAWADPPAAQAVGFAAPAGCG